MKKPLRGAIIGFGQAAEKAHVPGFARAGGLELAAVAESQPQRAQAARAALPKARLYGSIEELLAVEEGLDFVDVATPPFLHGAQVLAALAAGCHVLCEKPLTLDPEQMSAAYAAADQAGRTVFVVHNWSYSPQWQKIFDLLRSAGPVSHAQLSVLRLQPAAGSDGGWRKDAAKAGGGILVDHGWHALYLLHRLFEKHPGRLSAALSEGAVNRCEDSATVFLEFPAATAALHLTWRSSLRYNGALIHAQNATIELRDDEVALRKDGEPARLFSFPQKLSAGSTHPEWFASMLSDFKLAVENPASALRNRQEADFCLKTVLRAYHGARVGRSHASVGLR